MRNVEIEVGLVMNEVGAGVRGFLEERRFQHSLTIETGGVTVELVMKRKVKLRLI